MSGVTDRLLAASRAVNCGPYTFATINPAGRLSRLNRLKTAPLRSPFKTSKTMVTIKRTSTRSNIYLIPLTTMTCTDLTLPDTSLPTHPPPELVLQTSHYHIHSY